MKPKKNVITRRPIVVGNWKMHRTASDTQDLLQDIVRRVSRVATMDLVACPPPLNLSVVTAS
jgi:triosephosphate isomerase